jgi:hypothetical protein
VWRGATDTWAGTTNYAANAYVQPSVPNTFIYKVTTDNGSSGAGEPTWPTTVGGTVADGDLVWTCEAGIPQGNDDVALAGFIVTWDTAQTRIPATGTLNSISSTGTAGQITLALDNAAFHGGASLYSTLIQCGTAPATYGMVYVAGTTDHVLTVVVGTGAYGLRGGSNTNAFGMYFNSPGTLNLTGDINANTASGSHGLYCNGQLVHNGDVKGLGSCGNAANGVLLGLGSLTASFNGNITGGNNISSSGINNSIGANVTLSATTNLIYGTYAPAYIGKSPAWSSA